MNKNQKVLFKGGEGSINLNDVKYLSTTRSNNEQFKQEDQVFFKFVNDLQGCCNVIVLLIFLIQYNYKQAHLELFTKECRWIVEITNTKTSIENYIAKDIASYLPKTADLDKIVIDMVGGEILISMLEKMGKMQILIFQDLKLLMRILI